MKVAVDLQRCQGNGACERRAPAVFALAAGTATVRVLQDQPGPELHRSVRDAARRCPTRAITVAG